MTTFRRWGRQVLIVGGLVITGFGHAHVDTSAHEQAMPAHNTTESRRESIE
jgi:hypothetical protein